MSGDIEQRVVAAHAHVSNKTYLDRTAFLGLVTCRFFPVWIDSLEKHFEYIRLHVLQHQLVSVFFRGTLR